MKRLLDYLDRSGSTLIVLTEWREGLCGRRIAAWADEHGLHHASLADGGTANGVFVAAKQPFGVTSRRPAEAGAGVLLQVEFANFDLLACYFPQGEAKRPFFARCCEIASEHAGLPFALMGDLNTGNQVVDKDVLGARFHCAAEFDSLSSQHNLLDLWRRSNGDEAREWSWYSARRNGFRIDHAFANQAFVELADPCCHYDHAPRDGRDTDHSALHVVCSDSLAR